METRINAGPPPWLDRAVARLLPPMVRDEVAGDLYERFLSVGHYLHDALTTIPRVVANQILRTNDWRMLHLLAFTLFAALGGFEAAPIGESVPMWQRVPLAVLPGFAALLLRNAYRSTACWNAARATGDVATLIVTTVVAQQLTGLIEPAWAVPAGYLTGGLLFASVALVVLRSGVEITAIGVKAETIDQIERDYRRFRAAAHFKARTEFGTISLLITVALWFSLTARPLVAAAGLLWVALMVPLLIAIRRRMRRLSVPVPTDKAERLTFYHDALRRQQDALGLIWCYFLPLFAAFVLNMIVRGLLSHRPALSLAGMASAVALGLLIAWLTRDGRRRIGRDMAALQRLAPC